MGSVEAAKLLGVLKTPPPVAYRVKRLTEELSEDKREGLAIDLENSKVRAIEEEKRLKEHIDTLKGKLNEQQTKMEALVEENKMMQKLIKDSQSQRANDVLGTTNKEMIKARNVYSRMTVSNIRWTVTMSTINVSPLHQILTP